MKCKDKKCLNELPSYETKVTFCTECRRRFGEYMRASNDKLGNYILDSLKGIMYK